MEIERKYLVKELPDNLCIYESKKIEQGYLCHEPILRIRKSNEEYYLTYKSKINLEEKVTSAIVQNEIELPLTKQAYENLKKKVDNHMVFKTRYLIPISNGLTAELDIFEGILTGLLYVEVEFPDQLIAEDFSPPEWFGRELSSDKRFSNYRLSKLSSLEELTL